MQLETSRNVPSSSSCKPARSPTKNRLAQSGRFDEETARPAECYPRSTGNAGRPPEQTEPPPSSFCHTSSSQAGLPSTCSSRRHEIDGCRQPARARDGPRDAAAVAALCLPLEAGERDALACAQPRDDALDGGLL